MPLSLITIIYLNIALTTLTFKPGPSPVLDKAKEAGRRERAVVKYREQRGVVESMNIDLTFTVLFNLAQQYMTNEMPNEALNTYKIIV
ncbi:hypothetical protein ANCDUO_14197 [Ancylostoma duodenale]|uniref:Uncharacterized protein n=1 Tax=Ancylostoma duodenale TaxID=51022 RepID=A0A0C2GET8_9BILA|nr:hypothetical protein ANCDUO_14197 [Ancylostoma duodenale]